MELKPIEETLKNIDHERIENATRVKKIIEYIKEGLSEFDAMMLVGYNEVSYEEMKENFPLASVEIEKAKIEYKRTLLKTVSAAGIDGDEKLAMWLLEKQFGGEFNQKARAPSENTQTDLLITAIREIQSGGNTSTLIGIKSSTKRLIKENDIPHV